MGCELWRAKLSRALTAPHICWVGLGTVLLCGVTLSQEATLVDHSVVHIRQGFDDPASFAPGKLVARGDAAHMGGTWTGQDEPAFEIVTSPVRSRGQALKVARVDSLRRMLLRRDQALPGNRDFTVSFWCHADARGSVALFLYPDQAGRAPAAAGVSLMSQGRLRIYDPSTAGVDKWVYTGLRAPFESWFECRLRFDILEKLYRLAFVTEDGVVSESNPYPFLGDVSIQTLQFLNVPPAGNHVVIDDVVVAYDSAPPDTARNRRNWATEATIGTPELTVAIDGDRTTGVSLSADQRRFHLELKTNRPVGLIRVYSGRPDGSGRVHACRASGLNAAGQAPKLASPRTLQETAEDGCLEYAFTPETLSSLDIVLVGDGTGDAVFLREIEVYSPPVQAASILDAAFVEKVYGEFRLPVYEDQAAARLHLFNVRADSREQRVGVTLSERFSGTVIAPLREVELTPGENTVEFPIADLPDGSYIATVEDHSRDDTMGRRAKLRRLLRIQHKIPFVKEARYEMTGKRILFPDDHYLESHSSVRFEACRGRLVEAVKPVLKSEDFTQLGRRIYFDREGRLSVLFRRLNRRWMKEETSRDFVAVAADPALGQWDISPQAGKLSVPPQSAPVWDPEPPKARGNWRAKRVDGKPVRLRFYDPERDGPVVLNQVAFRRLTRSAAGTVMHRSDLDWSAIKPLAGSAWPVWFKGPGVGLVLTRECLLQEMPLMIGDFEDPKAANDNWAGQFLSDDGETLFYIHANLLRRFRPFNAPWDNLAKSSRMLTVYRTTDGINYERSYMGLPDESDPPASQHYGAIIRRAAGGNGLRLAYLLRYRAYTQQIDCVVSYSWDGIRWERFNGQDALVTNGPHGSWSAGHVWPGYAAVERDGKVYHLVPRIGGIYHFQSEIANSRTDETMKQVTGAWMRDRYEPRSLKECPLFDLFGSWSNLATHTRTTGVGVGVLIYRKDGLFCLAAGRDDGEFLSRPLVADGATLRINAEVGGGGGLCLDLTDADGVLLANYSGANAVRLESGDFMDQSVTFGRRGELPGGEFRIRGQMRDTKLYTISFGE